MTQPELDQSQTGNTCRLCHKPCEEEINYSGNLFCCVGCKTVYDILKTDAELVLPDMANFGNKFGYLDLEEVRNQILTFQSDTFARLTLTIPSIHCSSCVHLLELLPQFYDTIIQSRVNFTKKQLDILFKKELPISELVGLIASMGYEPAINLASGNETTKKDKRPLLRMAVAGFCFGNIMLLSLPEYLDFQFVLTSNFQHLFQVLSVFLVLPVVFYSSQEYFKSAIGGLRRKVFTIDVPIALGILALFLRSLYEVYSQIGPGYFDSLAGLVFFLLIGKWYQSKTYDSLSFDRDYTSYFPLSATTLVDGKETPIHIKNLKEGDEVIVHSQELIPCDAILESEEALLDYSFVSGESKPVATQSGNRVFAGGRNRGQKVKMRLLGSVDMSYLTNLWDQESFKKFDSTFQNLTDRISKYFTIAILVIASLSAFYWSVNDSNQVWTVITSVLIVACPCALALALPFTYGHAIRILGRHQFYLKNTDIVEKLARVSTIVFDKTGTLTYQSAKKVEFVGELNEFEQELVISAMTHSAHSLSQLIVDGASNHQIHEVSNYEELTGKGVKADCMGRSIMVGSADFIESVSTNEPDHTQVFVKIDNKIRGYFRIKHDYREGLKELLTSLRSSYRLLLLSGDKPTDMDKLKPFFDELSFNLKPADKLKKLVELNTNGESTAMVGDGLNDAGALKESDVGIAVADDIHQFSPSCQAIIDGGMLQKFPQFITFSKAMTKIVIIAFAFSFAYNIIGLFFAVTGHLSPLISAILMPLSSVTIIGLVVFMTSISEKRILN